ncbi:MAG: hypothetical protein LUG18_15380 [Candidatus Azobacteroides sp.]|nr:hypothetical protein [Candidatus Azobacteroides sp.]
MEKKNNSKIMGIGIGIFAIISIGLVAFIIYGIKKQQQQKEENQQITLTLPSEILTIINRKNHANLKPPTQKEEVRFKNYLCFQAHPFFTDTEAYLHIYDSEMNERLNQAYIPGATIDGIILSDMGTEVVGYYYKSSTADDIINFITGEENNRHTDSSGKEARKWYRSLMFVTIPEGSVIYTDTIWGSEPPNSIKSHEVAGTGSYPADDEVVKRIREIIKH